MTLTILYAILKTVNLISNIQILQRAEQERLAREYAGTSPVLIALWRRVECERQRRSNALLVTRNEKSLRRAK